MRLFIALNFDEGLKEVINELQVYLKEHKVKGRYVPLDNMHLTLSFIGEYDNAEKIMDIMDEIDIPDINLSLDNCGNFGDIFWLGIKENKELNDYVYKLRRRLIKEGIDIDKKKFKPHITLIRKCEFTEDVTVNIPSYSMKVKGVSLMKSEFTDNGVRYTELYFKEAV